MEQSAVEAEVSIVEQSGPEPHKHCSNIALEIGLTCFGDYDRLEFVGAER